MKNFIGAMLGRRESMYKFIYYHSFSKLILTYLFLAVGLAAIKILDLILVQNYIEGLNAPAFYLLSLGMIIPTIILLAFFLFAISTIIFILSKIFRKQSNFGQLTIAIQSIAPFFLVPKLMYSFAALAGEIVMLSIALHWLALASIIYFLYIVSKTASFFTTFSFFQSFILVILITLTIVGILYFFYLQMISGVEAQYAEYQQLIEANDFAAPAEVITT